MLEELLSGGKQTLVSLIHPLSLKRMWLFGRFLRSSLSIYAANPQCLSIGFLCVLFFSSSSSSFVFNIDCCNTNNCHYFIVNELELNKEQKTPILLTDRPTASPLFVRLSFDNDKCEGFRINFCLRINSNSNVR